MHFLRQRSSWDWMQRFFGLTPSSLYFESRRISTSLCLYFMFQLTPFQVYSLLLKITYKCLGTKTMGGNFIMNKSKIWTLGLSCFFQRHKYKCNVITSRSKTLTLVFRHNKIKRSCIWLKYWGYFSPIIFPNNFKWMTDEIVTEQCGFNWFRGLAMTIEDVAWALTCILFI